MTEATLSLREQSQLALLRLDLDQQYNDGTLSYLDHTALIGEIDNLIQANFARKGIHAGSPDWLELRRHAWRTLSQQPYLRDNPHIKPPWSEVAQPQMTTPVQVTPDVAASRSEPKKPAKSIPYEVIQPPIPVTPQPTPEQAIPPPVPVTPQPAPEQAIPPPVPVTSAKPSPYIPPDHKPIDMPSSATWVNLDPDTQNTAAPPPPKVPAKMPPTVPPKASWHTPVQHGPTATEQLMQRLSGWSSLAFPFLMQNIGWFIGGLSFLAGSVFLIANTAGFAKSFAVFAALFTYCILLLWGGYTLRRKNPQLQASTRFLFIISTLLMPLTLAAGLQTVVGAEGPIQLLISCAICGICIIVFYYLSRLAGGVIDAKLPKIHATWFLGLSCLQLTAPIIHAFPSLYLLALMHLLLLCALGVALLTFGRDWLQEIKAQRPYTAVFAASSLVYADLVSFVHVQSALPDHITISVGYYGLLTLLLSGLLFYIDDLIKRDWKGFTWLNQFSFACYATSFLGLWLSQQTAYQLPTFTLAAVLFFHLTWRYQTWAPLYIASGITLWGHYNIILRPLPWDSYFIATLPLIAALYVFGQWLQRAPALQQHLFYLLGGLTATTAYLSQLHCAPGVFGVFHLALITIFMYLWVQSPVTWLANIRARINVYYFPAHSIAMLYYLPLWTSPETQYSFSWLLLSALWLTIGLHQLRHARLNMATGSVNTAAIALFAALLIGFHSWTEPTLSSVVLSLGTALILLASAIGLQWRELTYGAFAALGATAVLFKYWALPDYQSQTGLGLPLTGFALLLLARWLEKKTPLPNRTMRTTPRLRAVLVFPLPNRTEQAQQSL